LKIEDLWYRFALSFLFKSMVRPGGSRRIEFLSVSQVQRYSNRPRRRSRPRPRNRKKSNGVEDEDEYEYEPKDELNPLPATLM